ncbi:MAG: XRE family transcriptional regulator [Chloroflexi bacterium]|nr:XRE family transcriptional regulator [Chloroflexota bacterium]
MTRAPINPEMLRWARERARRTPQDLAGQFPKVDRWERGEEQPTLKLLERFAKTVHVPVGYLFLPQPPVETVPIPDFRAGASVRARPSPELLETVYVCQQRQEWYRDFARSTGEDPLAFVGSARVGDDVEQTAGVIRSALDFDLAERRQMPTWTEALRRFIEQSDAVGILVMCNGVVGNNNRRHLDPDEFRGFAMADDLAPLVFINGADTKAAQMFTLAHELAHVWIGQSAVSDANAASMPDHRIERWCNQVAAELLVPLRQLRAEYRDGTELQSEMGRLARRFKVSTLVILRRIHDANKITLEEMRAEYEAELERIRAIKRPSGGDFYLTQGARLSKRFARAVVVSTLEGQTLYRDAFRMLGFSRLATFQELGRKLGVGV